ncbi:MAG: hypothetical protein PHN89_03880, partial [Candidatus Pacebacteria bacterium]|nr:hypothetical protein [Candidatus Paceibacterota bacterium]
SELPEEAGLMELNKSSLTIVRHAPQRKTEDIPLNFIASLFRCVTNTDIRESRETRQTEYENLKAWKYAGREMTEKEFKKIVDEKCKDIHWEIEKQINNEIKKEYDDYINENAAMKLLAAEFKCPIRYIPEYKVLELIKRSKGEAILPEWTISQIERLKENLERGASMAEKIIEGFKTKPLGE